MTAPRMPKDCRNLFVVPERLAKTYGFRTTVVQIDDWLGVFPHRANCMTLYTATVFISRAERGAGGSTEG